MSQIRFYNQIKLQSVFVFLFAKIRIHPCFFVNARFIGSTGAIASNHSFKKASLSEFFGFLASGPIYHRMLCFSGLTVRFHMRPPGSLYNRRFAGIVVSSFMCVGANASTVSTARIEASHLDLSKVEKVFVAPGLVSVIEFPQNIMEVRIGNPKSVKALISTVSPKELTVYLSSTSSIPTNLIVRAEKRIFVLDIVPSQSHHKDYLKIQGGFGGPTYLSSGIKQIEAIRIGPNDTKTHNSKARLQSSERMGL